MLGCLSIWVGVELVIVLGSWWVWDCLVEGIVAKVAAVYCRVPSSPGSGWRLSLSFGWGWGEGMGRFASWGR